MSALLVLVAHNGKTLQLEVHPTTRVDAVQQALVSFTKIPVSDQIVMCQGVRLDPTRPLSAYKLPVANPTEAEDHPVFLYNKSYLRPGHPGPVPEALPSLQVAVPAPSPVPPLHPLHTASSPLARALPDYERQFQHHLLVGQAYWDVGQKRIQRARQLLSEQEVQARAADAARANVEAHYTYILTSYQDFLDRYSVQHQAHTTLLASTQEALNLMASIELHPAVQTDRWHRLIDLVPQQKLTERHDSCRRSHEQFSAKVAELEGMFSALKSEVEALFLQAPRVDLDHLGQRLADMDRLTDEESTILQGLSADLKKIQALVEDTVRQLGANALSTSSIHDACGAMETINETHVQQLLPRLGECDRTLEGFGGTCVEAKLRMTQDVVEQLQCISGQQSKIRDMKNKLAAYLEVLQRQQEGFAELRHVHKLPAAYRYALSECLRRRAWGEVFASQAAKLAEHMGKLREKEAAKREGFQRQVERIIPVELLSRMGLLREPPHCQISAPAADPQLLAVAVQDVQRIPTDKAAHAAFLSGETAGGSGPQEGAGGTGRPGDAAEAEAAEGQAPNLEMENSKLRADLATQIALNCLNELRAPAQEPVKAAPKPKAGEGKPEEGKAGDTGAAGSSGSGAAKKAVRSDVEAVALLQRALASKDAYAAKLEQSNTALSSSLAKYEKRIAQLESMVQSYSQQLESSQQMVAAAASRAASGPLQASVAPSDPPGAQRRPSSPLVQSTILLVNLPASEGPLPPLGPQPGPPSPSLPTPLPTDLWPATTEAAQQAQPASPPQQPAATEAPPPPDPVLPAAQLLGGHTPPGAYSTIITAPMAASTFGPKPPAGEAPQHGQEDAAHPHPHVWATSHLPHEAHGNEQQRAGTTGTTAGCEQGQVGSAPTHRAPAGPLGEAVEIPAVLAAQAAAPQAAVTPGPHGAQLGGTESQAQHAQHSSGMPALVAAQAPGPPPPLTQGTQLDSTDTHAQHTSGMPAVAAQLAAPAPAAQEAQLDSTDTQTEHAQRSSGIPAAGEGKQSALEPHAAAAQAPASNDEGALQHSQATAMEQRQRREGSSSNSTSGTTADANTAQQPAAQLAVQEAAVASSSPGAEAPGPAPAAAAQGGRPDATPGPAAVHTDTVRVAPGAEADASAEQGTMHPDVAAAAPAAGSASPSRGADSAIEDGVSRSAGQEGPTALHLPAVGVETVSEPASVAPIGEAEAAGPDTHLQPATASPAPGSDGMPEPAAVPQDSGKAEKHAASSPDTPPQPATASPAPGSDDGMPEPAAVSPGSKTAADKAVAAGSGTSGHEPVLQTAVGDAEVPGIEREAASQASPASSSASGEPAASAPTEQQPSETASAVAAGAANTLPAPADTEGSDGAQPDAGGATAVQVAGTSPAAAAATVVAAADKDNAAPHMPSMLSFESWYPQEGSNGTAEEEAPGPAWQPDASAEDSETVALAPAQEQGPALTGSWAALAGSGSWHAAAVHGGATLHPAPATPSIDLAQDSAPVEPAGSSRQQGVQAIGPTAEDAGSSGHQGAQQAMGAVAEDAGSSGHQGAQQAMGTVAEEASSSGHQGAQQAMGTVAEEASSSGHQGAQQAMGTVAEEASSSGHQGAQQAMGTAAEEASSSGHQQAVGAAAEIASSSSGDQRPQQAMGAATESAGSSGRQQVVGAAAESSSLQGAQQAMGSAGTAGSSSHQGAQATESAMEGPSPAADADDDALQEAAQAVVNVVDTAGEVLEAAAQSVFAFLAGHTSPGDAATRRSSSRTSQQSLGITEPSSAEHQSPEAAAARHDTAAGDATTAGSTARDAGSPTPVAAAGASDADDNLPAAAAEGVRGGTAAGPPAAAAGVGTGTGAEPRAPPSGEGSTGEEEDAYIPDIDELEVPEGSSANGDGGTSGAGGYASRLLSSFLSRSLFGSAMLNDPSSQHPPHHHDN